LARLPEAVVTNNATGINLSGTFSGNGSGLTALDASQLTSGTLGDARLSSNVALRSGGNAFTGDQSFTGGNIGIGKINPSAALDVNGTVKANAFSGDGSGLTNLDSYVAKSGDTMTGPLSLPANGLVAGGSQLVLTSGNVGLGLTNPTSRLQVAGGDLGLGDGTLLGNQAVTIWLTNASGATRSAGEIVIIGGANNGITVATTGSSTAAVGVVYDTSIPSGAIGRIAIAGVVQVQSAGATTRGQHVVTSSTSGKAGSDGTPTSGASIGRWLESGGSAGSWRALLK
jgi:hypothetical protein